MNYQITIVRKEANPNFAEQLEEFNKANGRGMYRGDVNCEMPQREVTKNILMCELTEEQYKAIKAEVFKSFI